jgi:lambda family phage tail tape measure protein
MLEFQREGLRYADKQERMEAEIAKAKADGLKAGADQIVIDERIARIRESYAEKLTKSPRHAASVSDPFSSLNGLVKQAQVFDQGVGNDSAQNQQAKAILAIVDAGAKLIASGHDVAKVQAEVAQGVAALNNGYAKQAQILQDQNTAALKAYQDAIDDQITARRNEIDLQVQSIGMGQQEAQQLMAVARIREQAASKIEQLNRQRAQKGADTQFIDAEINAVKDSIPVLVGLENDRWERTQAAQANGINGMKAAIADFVDQQKNQAAIMYQITSGFLDGFSDAFADFVSGTKSAKDAFGSLIDDMYRQALKFLANQAIKRLFESFGGGMSGGGGWGGLISGLVGAFSGSGAGPGTIGAGLATGGIASPNSFHPVNENGPEIFTIHGRDYLSTGNSTVKVTPNGGGSRAVSVNQTIVVQGKINRRTSGQIAQDTARQQRIAAARNG